MIFASRIPNRDPKPHFCTLCSDRFARPKTTGAGHDTIVKRREKFNVTTTHPVNQNLVNFRRTAGPEREGLPFLLTMELAALRRGDRHHFGQEAADHAERVLIRYLRLLNADEQ
ncbi:hypothetical protein ACWGJ9_11320 [Curtobacterium citreum]